MPPEGRDERTLLEGLTATPEGDDRFVAVAPEGFGPQAFGGVVVAHAVNAALQTVLAQPDIKRRAEEAGTFVAYTPPEAVMARLRGEIAAWTDVVRTVGIKPD